ncbi:pyruvate decarboxylase-like protein [Protomyces lactucae-debilis]|uniref:Pyruvate decarboxylase-like protein n=1 Tax=Protomyces lactucae-debilis TaxID=2754530 RepID=A0A1Y2F988_PROLT|nr:pyruvate decarboxylase-like protein [Protomyces lactucae-debilis]ORY80480.1 pyruvate decarboxylase-like protein [Protomyces lactucae-debilis]
MGKTTVANYLLTRLAELGVESVFGVPGDYNLAFLDEFDKHKEINWVGCANELNAAYAADGYARVKKGVAALVTTFGVGELSAINGVAGAYSEHVPVAHIVGTPSTSAQKSGALLHHTLGNGDFSVFANMSKSISAATTNLSDPHTAPTEIDRVLAACFVQAHPVYIGLPTDMAYKEIDDTLLQKPLDLSIPQNDAEVEDYLVKEITALVHAAKKAIILVDACAIRHRVLDEVHALIKATQFPVFCTPMGKSAVDETHPLFGGIYIGTITQPHIQEAVESADLVLSIGALKSDFNTGSFSYHINKQAVVEFHSDKTQIKYATYPDIGMQPLLKRLATSIDVKQCAKGNVPTFENKVPAEAQEGPVIKQDWFWPTLGKTFIKSGDVIVSETGTSNFGLIDTQFPDNVIAVNQVLWGSIGYSVGATLGAALAAKELGRRCMLFVGDGSLQLTVQEISTMIRHGLKPILFVLNNEGYTIERAIHGPDAAYNDINTGWQYQNLLTFFGCASEHQASYKVATKDDVVALLKDEKFCQADKIQLVEVIMEKMDTPRALKRQAQLTSEANEKSDT